MCQFCEPRFVQKPADKCGMEDDVFGFIDPIFDDDYGPGSILYVDKEKLVHPDEWQMWRGKYVYPIRDMGANVWIRGTEGASAYRFNFCPICGRKLTGE